MVVIGTTEIGRSKHAALGPLAHPPAGLHMLISPSSRESIGFLSAGRAIGNEPLGSPTRSEERLAAPPTTRPSDPRDKNYLKFIGIALWLPRISSARAPPQDKKQLSSRPVDARAASQTPVPASTAAGSSRASKNRRQPIPHARQPHG